jgi:hypothetical protein
MRTLSQDSSQEQDFPGSRLVQPGGAPLRIAISAEALQRSKHPERTAPAEF